jgi:hypothetical protein
MNSLIEEGHKLPLPDHADFLSRAGASEMNAMRLAIEQGKRVTVYEKRALAYDGEPEAEKRQEMFRLNEEYLAAIGVKRKSLPLEEIQRLVAIEEQVLKLSQP